MAQVTPPQEPQSAAEYDDRTTAAVKSMLIEIGQILGSFKGKFTIIGGAVPWLLLANEDMLHVGTLDVDVGLDAEALGDGEYATLIGALQGHGYAQREGLRRFQLVRQVPAQDGGEAIDVVVDFLMPRDADIVKNNPPLISDFAVQRADGADLAMRFYQLVAVAGPMPDGGMNPCRDRGVLHTRFACDEGPCTGGPLQAEGCLRHLLLRAELPRWDRGTGAGMSRVARTCKW